MSWFDEAACKGMNTNLFFPDARGNPASYAEAKRVCNGCPVRTQCLNYAIDNSIDEGMFGGVPERKRINMRRDVQRPVECVQCHEFYRRRRIDGRDVQVCSESCMQAYTRERKNATRRLNKLNGGECSEDGCDTPALTRGMCNLHYKRWYKSAYPEQNAKHEANRIEAQRRRRQIGAA